MLDADLSLVPIPRGPEEFNYLRETPAEAMFNARRDELGIRPPCEKMPPRHFWADEDSNSDLLRESAKIAASRVLPGIIACRSCPLLPECYRMGTEKVVGRDGVYGGEYFNVIAASNRPSTKQAGVRTKVHQMLRKEGARNDLGYGGAQAVG